MFKTFLSILCIIIFFTKKANSEIFYLIGGLESSNYNINSSDINEIDTKLKNLGFVSSSTTTENEKLSYKIGIGIKFIPTFSFEASYLDFGKISFKTETETPDESLRADVELKGLNFDLLTHLGPFSISTGALQINDDVKVVSSLGNVNLPINNHLLPKIGINTQILNYRIELSRVYIKLNSYSTNLTFSYIFGLF